MKIKKHDYLAYAFILIMVLIVFRDFFFTPYDGLFLYYDDALNQVHRFYQQMWEMVRVDGFQMWDNASLFGSNYIASNSYYNLFSPFTLIIYFFDKSYIAYELVYMNMLKLFVSGLIAYGISRYYTDKLHVRLIVVMMLMFNGWIFTYAKYIFIWDAYVFMLLCVLGVERFLNEKKSATLFVGTFLLGICNYYFLYMNSFIIVIYFIFRFTVINGLKIRENFRQVIRFGIVYFLGIMSSMLIFLPSIMNVMLSPRVHGYDGDIFISLGQFFRFLTGFFAPPKIYGSFNGYLDYKFGNAGWNGGMSFFSLFITPILMPQLLVNRNREKNIITVLYMFIVVMVILVPVYYLLQQSMESRWFVLLVFANTYLVARIMDQQLDKRVLIVSYLLTLLIPIAIYSIVSYTHIQDMVQLNEYIRMIYTILFFYGIFIVFYVVGFKPDIMIVMILAIEIVIMNPLNHESFSIENKAYIDAGYSGLEYMEDLKKDYVKDERIDFITDHPAYFLDEINIGSVYNMASFTHYSSLYNYNQYDYLLNRFVVSGEWYFYPQDQKFSLKNELGLAYYVNSPTGKVERTTIPGYFTKISETDEVDIYKNDYHLGLVQLKKGSINIDEIENYSILEQDILMRENVFIENPVFAKIDNTTVLEKVNEESGMYYLNADEGDVIYIENGNDYYGKINYTFDDLYYNNLNHDLAYVDFYMNEPVHYLSVEGDAAEVSVYKQASYIDYLKGRYDDVSENIRFLESENDHFSYEVNSDERAYISTAIAYDRGWKVYIDQQKAEVLNINNGFLGTYIEPGVHTVEFVYETPYLRLGALISIISTVLYLIYRKRYEYE